MKIQQQYSNIDYITDLIHYLQDLFLLIVSIELMSIICSLGT